MFFPARTRNRASPVYMWISAWFILTAPIMIMDAFYCLLRPRSMTGGDLHWMFPIYELYQEIDHVYGVKAYENGEGFASAAAILNLLEISANLLYLFTTHILPHPAAPLIGYSGALMTLSKTILYVAQEYFCDWCAIGHNDFGVAMVFWFVPNL
ncbi:hypothetical protein HGRIS_000896 [Hohenbuehelia grisea]|uniref:Uncharacterized protein n=1 Tax=Hohenbuehelia grisea TaxID=104357 RepID=A0ABR3IQ74_9AGAR